MLQFFHRARNQKGFTLVETLVSVSVFTVIMGLMSTVLFNTFAGDRKTRVSRELSEETRIVLERIAKEVRKGTIDYEEYWSWYRMPNGPTGLDTDYGKNYGQYAVQFYRDANFPGNAPTDPINKNRADENIGENIGNSALGNAQNHPGCNKTDPSLPNYIATTSGHEQCELYLITADGTGKTIIRTKEDPNTPGEYRLMMLKLNGYDYGYVDDLPNTGDAGENDNQIDTWLAENDFIGHTFKMIQPDTITIKSLRFFISPIEDPRKAFACFEPGAGSCPTEEVQIQPRVTIVITAEPSKKQLRATRGNAPSITLQTTVTARAENEVKSLK